MSSDRREFMKKMGLGSLLSPIVVDDIFDYVAINVKNGFTILFQGDSITDGNRTRNTDWNHVMGHGYQFIIASKLWFENPKSDLMFYNRGVSGNRITDLEKRWQEDALDLKPDIISILIGVNDAMSVVNNQNPQSIEAFESSYRNILQKTKEQLPNSRIVICEPFILDNGHVSKKPDVWHREITKRKEIAFALSKEFDTIYVPFQQVFIDACKKAPTDFWIWDGIHPMPAGHELMARQWLKVVAKYLIT